MLVLSRRRDERIIIGEGYDAIVICIAEIDGDKVRIGIDAPKSVPVNRQEVYLAKLRDKRSTE